MMSREPEPSAPDPSGYEPMLTFWFGELDEHGIAAPSTSKRWFLKDEAFDRLIRERFEAEHAAVLAGARDHWLGEPRGRLAAIIVLDQLSRNMYRGTPGMFAADDKALQWALDGIAQGLDRALCIDERVFCYLPLMHSEELPIQQRCVELFTAFRAELPGELARHLDPAVKFAERHRDIVERWGRFPHRNAILGRESTPAEVEFLQTPGSSF